MSEKTFKILNGDVSDGYHTFDELYAHRCLLFLSLVQTLKIHGDFSYWVRDHFDGWDLVVCDLPMIDGKPGQISYHVPVKYRAALRAIPERKLEDHKWDGHTSQDVVARISELLGV